MMIRIIANDYEMLLSQFRVDKKCEGMKVLINLTLMIKSVVGEMKGT